MSERDEFVVELFMIPAVCRSPRGTHRLRQLCPPNSNLIRAGIVHKRKKSRQFSPDQRQKVPPKLTAKGIFRQVSTNSIQASEFLVANRLAEQLSYYKDSIVPASSVSGGIGNFRYDILDAQYLDRPRADDLASVTRSSSRLPGKPADTQPKTGTCEGARWRGRPVFFRRALRATGR